MPSGFVILQHLLPQHLVSRVVLGATRITWPPVKNGLIRAFMRSFRPDLSDAELTDPMAYESFNAFFTRALQPGARPLAGDGRTLVSPVDGTVSQLGAIEGARLLQAKGHTYSLEALLSGAAADWAPRFRDGKFATIYLAPYNYHRVHMPCEGLLREGWYVPGRLFSVNARTAQEVPGLFARNERLVLLFEGPVGPFAVILVGALNVGSMSTVWHGQVTPRRPRRPCALPRPNGAKARLPRGAEVGRFNMGSTVILLFGEGCVQLQESLSAGSVVRMGQDIGHMVGRRAGSGA